MAQVVRRELVEETGVDAASLLTQFGAYGDPGRDPRMNVVTVGYVAVLRDVDTVVAGSAAADASLVPVADVLDGQLELAFDHVGIVRDAIERIRVELEVSGVATAFVGSTFTLGRRARPGAAGGKPAELFRAGKAWNHGGPIRRPQRPKRSQRSQKRR